MFLHTDKTEYSSEPCIRKETEYAIKEKTIELIEKSMWLIWMELNEKCHCQKSQQCYTENIYTIIKLPQFSINYKGRGLGHYFAQSSSAG